MSIDLDPALREALAAGQPVVALESTLLCHGIPAPRNRELAAEIEDAVRAAGAVPGAAAASPPRCGKCSLFIPPPAALGAPGRERGVVPAWAMR